MLAMAAAPPTIPPQRVQPEAPKPDNDATASAVFGNKRYYKLTVNMPNLTSASGSWVIRFAELHPQAAKAQIPLAAPVPLSKSDPAYPPELISDKVEGTVILYAIIRADGSITDIKIINSVNARLDYNAIAALHRWSFQPGSKDGQPVDVEAVVQVPFKVKRL
jgi:TonB family protein